MADVVLEIVTRGTSLSGDTDEFENRWTWKGDPATPVASITADLDGFYCGGVAGFAAGIGSWMGNELSRTTALEHTVYDITAFLDGSPHGAPIGIVAGGLLPTPESSDSLPGQIAAVVDYHADLTGIAEFGSHSRPRARRRGRHYFGPICFEAYTQQPTTEIGVWKGTFVTELQTEHHNLLHSSTFGPGWVVWSRKDAAVHPVIGGWVDTTPHRARRREEPTGIKQFWS